MEDGTKEDGWGQEYERCTSVELSTGTMRTMCKGRAFQLQGHAAQKERSMFFLSVAHATKNDDKL